MKRTSIWGYVLAGAAIVLAGVIGTLVVSRLTSQPPAGRKGGAVRVRVSPVERGVIERELLLTGELSATASVEVRPKITGRLERLALSDGTAVSEGTAVKKGESIAVLESNDLQAQLEQARAAVGMARAALATAEVRMKDAVREKQRMQNLFSSGSATEQQRDRAEVEHDGAVAAREQAQAQLVQAQAAQRLAEVMLNEATLESPMDGLVDRKYVDPGAMVGPSTTLLRVVPMEELRILLAVPGIYISMLRPGETPVRVQVDSYPDEVFPARVAKLFPSLDRETRTVTAEVLVPNRRASRGDWLLRPGMYATVRVVIHARADAVRVPVDSMIRSGDSYIAFVAEGETARTRTVRTGIHSGRMVEVVDGLNAGERLIVTGQQRLTDGQLIEIVP